MSVEYYIEVIRAKPRHFWTRIKSYRNRKILWTSEVITTKYNALNPVKKLIKNIGKEKCKVVFQDRLKKTSEVI